MEGAESGGVLGFAEGMGRGLVGAVTKPLVGFFDMASNVTAGVRETTMIFDPNDITRERLPRYVGIDGILRVCNICLLFIIYVYICLIISDETNIYISLVMFFSFIFFSHILREKHLVNYG